MCAVVLTYFICMQVFCLGKRDASKETAVRGTNSFGFGKTNRERERKTEIN